MTPRTTVTGRRRVSSTRTDWRVQSDSPRFPRPIAPSQSTYCTWIGRSSPSFALRSSRSLPYAFSSSMSWTTSPGIRRGRVNTMSEAISSDGTATRRRRRTYLRMRALDAAASESRLLVDPGGHQPPAIVEAVVRHVVLDVRVPRREDPDRPVGPEQRLIGEVALDVEHDLLALGDVEGPPLQPDHLRELGVVHAPDVEPLAGHEPAIEVRLGVGPGTAQSDEHLVELSEDRARDERAVLPQLQLGVDAGGLPVLEGDLHEIIEVGPVPGPGRLHRRLEPVRVAGLGQEALGVGRAGLVEPPALGSQLIDRDRPVRERGGDRGVRRPAPLGEGERLEALGEVAGARQGPPDPEVAERRDRELEADGAAGEPRVLGGLQTGLPPGHRHVEPAHGVLVLGAEVGLPAKPGGQARGRVLV